MEAMLGMKWLMESNTATAAAASTTVEANPALPTTAHHPIPNIVGWGRSTPGHDSNPHPGYNRGAYPYGLPPNYTPPAMHEDVGHVTPLILEGEPPRHPDGVHENPREHAQGDANSYSSFPAKGLAPTHYLNPTSRESLEQEKWHANRGRILAFQKDIFFSLLVAEYESHQEKKWTLFAPLKRRHVAHLFFKKKKKRKEEAF